MELLLTNTGANELAYLAGVSASGAAFYRQIPQRTNGAKPLFQGSIEDFVSLNPQLQAAFQNVAKRCPNCGKSCATILPRCNGCSSDLAQAPAEFTENVCMAFIYGVERGQRFPLALSLRLETADVLVYDDLLARGSLHLNAIPTDCHLPDWRYLLRNPSKGLELMRRLDEACWVVTRDQFWHDETWRSSTFRQEAFSSADDFRSHIYAGLNSVPSQFQVHLQYMSPGILPVDYHHFLFGKRFVKDRWLPFEYVMDSLRSLERHGGIPAAHTMTMSDLFHSIHSAGGPCYEQAFASAIRRYNMTHRACANWRPEHFEAVVYVRHTALRSELKGAGPDSALDGTAEVRPLAGAAAGDLCLEQGKLEQSDKLLIQSYGRPYDRAGKPQALSFYAFAKRPGQVLTPDEWASELPACMDKCL